MKLAFLTYGCDKCGEESPHRPTWMAARREAKKAHWQFIAGPEGERHLCPAHREDS